MCAFLEEHTLDIDNSTVRELWNMANSLTRNVEEFLNYFVSRKTDEVFEGFNSKISTVNNKEMCFRNMENFKKMIYFYMSGFDFPFIPIMN